MRSSHVVARPHAERLTAYSSLGFEPVEYATTAIDRLAYDEALSVFLCAPQALYAVNKNVEGFEGYAATFELAETSVSDRHWSRR